MEREENRDKKPTLKQAVDMIDPSNIVKKSEQPHGVSDMNSMLNFTLLKIISHNKY